MLIATAGNGSSADSAPSPSLPGPASPALQGAAGTPSPDTAQRWWRDAVIYQVYVRSFLDSTGDGIGDLAGVRTGLPYLKKLGVDGIWLSPFYPSPQHDHGYDVADYREVDPVYGDLAEFDSLVADAHRLGLKVLLDIVPNHCSSEHPWFRAALADGPGSPARSLFHFADGRGEAGELPPNNWRAMFGGPAWSRVKEASGAEGQWYLHMFTPEQPDLNWRNPAVAADFDQVLRFWLDRGVDGFRIDVAAGLFKHPELPDSPTPRPTSGPATRSTRWPGTSPRCTRCGATGARCARSTRPATAMTGCWSARSPYGRRANRPRTSGPTNCTRRSSSTC